MGVLAIGLVLANLSLIGIAFSIRVQARTITRQRAEIDRLVKALQKVKS